MKKKVRATNFALRDLKVVEVDAQIETWEFLYPIEKIPTDKQIEKAILDTYRQVGRVRIPLPALVTSIMRKVGTKGTSRQFLAHFQAIHHFIRTHWGNQSLLSRKTGWKFGGIKIRDSVKL